MKKLFTLSFSNDPVMLADDEDDVYYMVRNMN